LYLYVAIPAASFTMKLPDYYLADRPAGAPMTATLIVEACQTLRRNRERYLAGRSTPQIIDLLSSLSREWQQPDNPFRGLALELGPVATGFSRETISAGLDTFFGEITTRNLEALIDQDLGHLQRLDQFTGSQANELGRRIARANGPQLLAHVMPGNIPSSSLMGMVLGLLVRSAQFVKCATGAALLPRLFAHSIYEADSRIGACLEIAEWMGGRADLEKALFGHANCVSASGNDETLAQIRLLVPASVRFIGHGHRVSFGYVDREALSRGGAKRVANRAAVDVSAWDQLGCLSPHLFYVENGGAVPPDVFAETLAVELDACTSREPRGDIPTEMAAAIAGRRAMYEIRAAASEETRLWKSADSTAWTVVYEADPLFQTSCLNRFVYVKPVANLSEALRAAEPVRSKVSAVGMEASGERAQQLAAELAEWGVTRICPIGRMQRPPLTWRHDGHPTLGRLVTWTDWEQ
jgi:hypothetical protein